MKIKNNLFIITIIAFVCCYGCDPVELSENCVDDSELELLGEYQKSLASDYRVMDLPIDSGEGMYFKSIFNINYISLNANVYNLSCFVNLDDFAQAIDYTNPGSGPDIPGFAFYPAHCSGSGGNLDTITFAFVKAKRQADVICPVNYHGQTEPKYYLLTYPDSIREISKNFFETVTSNYHIKMSNRNLFGVVNQVNNLNHPGACFFRLDSFNEFMADNQISIAITNTNAIRIENAVYPHTGVDPGDLVQKYYIHSPLLTLRDNMVNLRLNNTNYPGEPFKMKSMDVAYLCPPECPSIGTCH
jgi:hypothetical protein